MTTYTLYDIAKDEVIGTYSASTVAQNALAARIQDRAEKLRKWERLSREKALEEARGEFRLVAEEDD